MVIYGVELLYVRALFLPALRQALRFASCPTTNRGFCS